MPGLVGFYTFGEDRDSWEANRFLYYGLNALQGRGQESISLATIGSDNKLRLAQGKGGVEDFFERNLDHLPRGFLGIGQGSSYDNDYLIHVREPYELALALDGKTDQNPDKVESSRIFAQELSQVLHEAKDPLKAASQLVHKVGGGYSFLALTHRQELLAARNPLGVKPLEVGGLGFDIGVVVSETCALDVMGAEQAGLVEPGETLLFTPEHILRNKSHSDTTSLCSLEYVYLARLDSTVNDIPVAQVRNRLGRELAKTHPVKADRVIGIPETGLSIATGYSQASSIPQEQGFVRTGKQTRTLLKHNQQERLAGVQLKLNPVKAGVDNKDLVLIDDIVARGNTLRNTVLNLKRKGAGRIHVRIGSPPLVSECPYGVEIPPRDELIGNSLNTKEISDLAGADSLAFLTRDKLQQAVGLPRQRLCMKCFRQSEVAQ